MLRKLKSLFGTRSVVRLGWHHAKSYFAMCRYGFPAKNLQIIGVTGTDGKTTTVGMITHILRKKDISVGALSTAFKKINDETEWNETEKTSPSPFYIQEFLRRLVREGCTHAVIEYSSHGLVQGRTNFTNPCVAGITNTAMEHLDYHGTMKQYRKDKSILFKKVRGFGLKVINMDDDIYELLERIPTRKSITYSVKNNSADLYAYDINTKVKSTKAVIKSGHDTYGLELPIPGEYNVENALCAIGCCDEAGVSVGDAIVALRTFENAAGRLQSVEVGQSFSVFIDFTVTPQAFEKTLQTLRNIVGSDKRILVMTGSCGDRMKEKRPIVGKICSELADVVVITDEEAYTEDPLAIIEEVWSGVDQSSCDAHKIPDRREAIAKVFSLAKDGDAVLLCGLGSYPSRVMNEGMIDWDEKAIAEELLQKIL